MKHLSPLFWIIIFPVFLFSQHSTECDRSSLYFDFEDCKAYFAQGTYIKYDEFTASSRINTDCSTISIHGNHLYRSNPSKNPHSCASGKNASLAMCISSSAQCAYDKKDEKAVIIDIEVTPLDFSIGGINSISFHAKAPKSFKFFDGASGANNYPSKFAFAVYLDDVEIYKRENIPTHHHWRYYNFDFSDMMSFQVTEESMFRVKILPYCLSGVASDMTAWEIDNLEIKSYCPPESINELKSSAMSIGDTLVACDIVGIENSFDFSIDGASGKYGSWLITNSEDQVLKSHSYSQINFDNIEEDLVKVYYVAHSEPLMFDGFATPFSISEECAVVSEPVIVKFESFQPLELRFSAGETVIEWTKDDAKAGRVEFESVSSEIQEVKYLLVNDKNTIIEISHENSFDLNPFLFGTYYIQAISYYHPPQNLKFGRKVDDLVGCFSQSNRITISYLSWLREDLDDNGIVDIGDFLLFNPQYNMFCEEYCRADFNDSGKVEVFDFLWFLTKMGEKCE